MSRERLLNKRGYKGFSDVVWLLKPDEPDGFSSNPHI